MKNSSKSSIDIYKSFFALALILILSACISAPRGEAQREQAPRQANNAKSISQSAEALKKSQQVQQLQGEVKIALLAPLTGRAAKLGKSFLDAAALGTMTEGSGNVRITPYDTQGTMQGAVAATKLAIEGNPDVIIGPLFSDEVRAISSIIRASGIPVLAFSNDMKVAGNGVYLLGLSPSQQIARLVDYSASNGIRGFAATQPLNVLGNEVARALKGSAAANGKQLYFLEDYTTYSKPNYIKIAAAVASKYSNQGRLNTASYALVMPESGRALDSLLSSLENEGITSRNMRFIGTAAWDTPKTHNNPRLDGAWYASVPYANMNSFMVNFQENFGYRPAQVASLAYDAVLLSAEIGKQGFNNGALMNPQGYYGANGSYRFLSNGQSERGYDIVEINRGRITVVDFAPSSF